MTGYYQEFLPSRPRIDRVHHWLRRRAIETCRFMPLPLARAFRRCVHEAFSLQSILSQGPERPVGIPSPLGGLDALPGPETGIVHVIGSLAAGGTERQLSSYVAASARLGKGKHTVLTMVEPIGEHAHYLSHLVDAGVEVRRMGARTDPSAMARLKSDRVLQAAIGRIPADIVEWVVELLGEFLASRPQVVHAWLDHANIAGGLAATLADVPVIRLSLRSVNPTNFPDLHRGWMRSCYRRLAVDPRVGFQANSRPGALDYARWIGIDPERIPVILNAIDLERFRRSPDEQVVRLRDELAADGMPIVLAVTRLSEEKRPFDLVAAARILASWGVRARIVVAGDGVLRQPLEHAARDLAGRVLLLGRRTDIPALMSASTALILCSRIEGTPNVIIEAQAMGLPVIATSVGGIPDIIDDGASGLLCPPGDPAAMASAIRRMLENPIARERMSAHAQSRARTRFGIERMVTETQRDYLANGGRDVPGVPPGVSRPFFR